jgi:hypothetical protein
MPKINLTELSLNASCSNHCQKFIAKSPPIDLMNLPEVNLVIGFCQSSFLNPRKTPFQGEQ